MGALLFIIGFICFAGAAGLLLVAFKSKFQARAMYLVLTAIVIGLLGTMVWYQTAMAPM